MGNWRVYKYDPPVGPDIFDKTYWVMIREFVYVDGEVHVKHYVKHRKLKEYPTGTGVPDWQIPVDADVIAWMEADDITDRPEKFDWKSLERASYVRVIQLINCLNKMGVKFPYFVDDQITYNIDTVEFQLLRTIETYMNGISNIKEIYPELYYQGDINTTTNSN